MGLCDKAQKLYIRFFEAKGARKKAVIRRALRLHMETCEYCLKQRKHGNQAVYRARHSKKKR